jgi:hypothetical protein
LPADGQRAAQCGQRAVAGPGRSSSGPLG